MLKILIVEDEPLMAATLKHLIELNPLYTVTATSDDLLSSLEAVAKQAPDLALVDLKLANDADGFSIAARLRELDILCLFITGNVPSIPIPDFAIGCLAKPFNEETLVHALSEAEDIVRGHDKFVRCLRLPDRLQTYSEPEGQPADHLVPQLDNEFEAVDQVEDVNPSLVGRIWTAVCRPMGPRVSVPAG